MSSPTDHISLMYVMNILISSSHILPQDAGFLFANIPNKKCRLRFGPIVSYLIQIWRTAELHCKVSWKWHTLTPLFNNCSVLIGGRPILCSPWNNSNIRTLKNVYCDTGLCTFQDFRGKYNVPVHSFFFLPPTQVIFKSTGCLFAASTTYSPNI